MLDAYIYDGVRSPFGRQAGGLARIRPDDLLAQVMQALMGRSKFKAEQFEDVMAIPADDEFWQTVVADPGATGLFADAVYDRGAATLYALRQEIGAEAFGELSRAWPQRFADSTATTADFQALAEEISGRDLAAFFDEWVRTPGKPTP